MFFHARLNEWSVKWLLDNFLVLAIIWFWVKHWQDFAGLMNSSLKNNECEILVFKVNKSGTHYQITVMAAFHMERVFEEEFLFRL